MAEMKLPAKTVGDIASQLATGKSLGGNVASLTGLDTLFLPGAGSDLAAASAGEFGGIPASEFGGGAAGAGGAFTLGGALPFPDPGLTMAASAFASGIFDAIGGGTHFNYLPTSNDIINVGPDGKLHVVTQGDSGYSSDVAKYNDIQAIIDNLNAQNVKFKPITTPNYNDYDNWGNPYQSEDRFNFQYGNARNPLRPGHPIPERGYYYGSEMNPSYTTSGEDALAGFEKMLEGLSSSPLPSTYKSLYQPKPVTYNIPEVSNPVSTNPTPTPTPTTDFTPKPIDKTINFDSILGPYQDNVFKQVSNSASRGNLNPAGVNSANEAIHTARTSAEDTLRELSAGINATDNSDFNSQLSDLFASQPNPFNASSILSTAGKSQGLVSGNNRVIDAIAGKRNSQSDIRGVGRSGAGVF